MGFCRRLFALADGLGDHEKAGGIVHSDCHRSGGYRLITTDTDISNMVVSRLNVTNGRIVLESEQCREAAI